MERNDKLYNYAREEMLENGFVLLNDDGEYLIGYKAHLNSRQVELTKLDSSVDEKLVRITLTEEELKELANSLKQLKSQTLI